MLLQYRSGSEVAGLAGVPVQEGLAAEHGGEVLSHAPRSQESGKQLSEQPSTEVLGLSSSPNSQVSYDSLPKGLLGQRT